MSPNWTCGSDSGARACPRTDRSWAPEESQIESREHQDDANVSYQPLRESISEERDIQSNYDGDHCHQVKRDSNLSAHFNFHGLYYK
jgi:hypothetical protein